MKSVKHSETTSSESHHSAARPDTGALSKSKLAVESYAEKHLQLVLQSEATLKSTVGMKTLRNVTMNLKVTEKSLLYAEEFWDYLTVPGAESTVLR